MKKVVLLATGGTIASAEHEDGRSKAGALPGEVLARQIQLHDDITLDVKSVFQKPSNAITLFDQHYLRQQCQALIDSGEVDGIVITHGTDTLEETAYFLDTTLKTGDVTVVVTGSQRVPHAMGTDAFVNLQDAVHVAASPQTRGLGVTVVFNEMIYSAAHVRKVSSFQINGFDAPALGCLGIIDNGVVTVYQRPVRLPIITPASVSAGAKADGATPSLPVVDIVNVYLDARPALLQAAIDSGAQGIVIDGIGRGHVPPAWMDAIRSAIDRGVIVLICSSTLHGPVYQTYEFQGSLHDLESAGAIGISGLTARKARIRLIALLESQKQVSTDTVKAAFSAA